MRINTVGIYWSARRESAEDCAERLGRYLRALKQEFPVLANWYRKTTVSEAISLDGDSNSDLYDILVDNRNRRDIGGSVIENLGFRVDLWNKRRDSEAISLGVTCGLFSTSAGPSNALYMTLPRDLESLSLQGDNVFRRLLLLQIEAWCPDWGAVFASQGDAVKRRVGVGPFLDSLLWINDGLATDVHDFKVHSSEAILGGKIYVG